MGLPATSLTSELSKTNAWANQWKTSFNPEKDNFMCLFILIKKNMTHLPLAFNNNPAKTSIVPKTPGCISLR